MQPYYPSSLSGPAESTIPTYCRICKADAVTECDNCQDPICQECAIRCSRCPGNDEYCISCAIKRGYAEINSAHYCENHALDFEDELEAARR